MRQVLFGTVTAFFLAFASTASAQLQDEPYGFAGGGPGLSTAGKQAILAEELTGATPDNLVRRNGVLLNVTEGPDGVAILRTRGDRLVPTGSVFDRTAIAGGRRGASAGFDIVESTTGFALGVTGAGHTGATVSGWTASVSGGAAPTPRPQVGGDAIDQWTRQAHRLPPARW